MWYDVYIYIYNNNIYIYTLIYLQYIFILVDMAQPEPSQLPESFKVAEAQLLCAMKQGAILLQRLIHINDPVQETLQRRRERIGMSENWVDQKKNMRFIVSS